MKQLEAYIYEKISERVNERWKRLKDGKFPQRYFDNRGIQVKVGEKLNTVNVFERWVIPSANSANITPAYGQRIAASNVLNLKINPKKNRYLLSESTADMLQIILDFQSMDELIWGVDYSVNPNDRTDVKTLSENEWFKIFLLLRAGESGENYYNLETMNLLREKMTADFDYAFFRVVFEFKSDPEMMKVVPGYVEKVMSHDEHARVQIFEQAMRFVFGAVEHEFKKAFEENFFGQGTKNLDRRLTSFVNDDLYKILKETDMANFQDGFLGLQRYALTKQLFVYGALLNNQQARETMYVTKFDSGDNVFSTIEALFMNLDEQMTKLDDLHKSMKYDPDSHQSDVGQWVLQQGKYKMNVNAPSQFLRTGQYVQEVPRSKYFGKVIEKNQEENYKA